MVTGTHATPTHHPTASEEVLNFNPPHAPHQNAIEAFNVILPTIKSEIIKSRHHWDKHEPKMWSRAAGLSDHELTAFTIEEDLVEVRSAATSYGNIILGKIRIPAVKDAEGEGFVHVRYVVHFAMIDVDKGLVLTFNMLFVMQDP